MIRKLTLTFACLSGALAGSTASAHFPWMAVEDGKVVLFFGEDPSDRTYKLPESITKAEVHALAAKGKPQKVELAAVETDDFVGMSSDESIKDDAAFVSQTTYGIYHGMRLEYYTQHQGGKLPADRKAYRRLKKQLDLHAQAVDTENGVDVYVMWQGKPLADAEVKLFCQDGHEEGNATTDKDGKVSFNDKQVEDGLNGILVGHTQADATGKLGDAEYKSVAHYLTMTFQDPQDFEK